MDNEKYLQQRNELLVEIANGFHRELQRLAYDMDCSLMDETEEVLLDVLNGYAYEGRITWANLDGTAYVFVKVY